MKGRLTIGINMNAGQRINLRLRPPGSPDGFYEFDQLVLVMLHEVSPCYRISYIVYRIWNGKMEYGNGTDDSLLISNLVRMILLFISYLRSWRRNIMI
jgi:hypothetical protein